MGPLLGGYADYRLLLYGGASSMTADCQWETTVEVPAPHYRSSGLVAARGSLYLECHAQASYAFRCGCNGGHASPTASIPRENLQRLNRMS